MSDEQVGRFVLNKDTDFLKQRRRSHQKSFENLEKLFSIFAGEQNPTRQNLTSHFPISFTSSV